MNEITLQMMHDKLKTIYHYNKFEGRNGTQWGFDYSWVVAETHLEWLYAVGRTSVSAKEARGGKEVWIFPQDFLPVELITDKR